MSVVELRPRQQMPQSVEAEMALIGAALSDTEACIDALDRVRPEHFFDGVHAKLWDAICKQARLGKADVVTVSAALSNDQGFAEWGGKERLFDLWDRAQTWAVDQHAEIILDRAARRSISHLTDEISRKAYGLETSAEGVLADLERGAAEIARDGVSREAWRPLSIVAEEALTVARERRGMPGLGIGLTEVDRITGGLRAGQLTLLAGRPGMGKSTAALCLAKGVAGHGRGVAFFSLEMTEPELGLRMACDVAFNPGETMYSGQDSNPAYSKAEWGSLDAAQWDRLDQAREIMAEWPIMFDCRAGLTCGQILSAARRVMRQWERAGVEPGCIIVDHLGLIRPEQSRSGNKVAEIADISGALREMAKALKVPVVALCQLSRDVEKRDGKDRKPNLSDLRWAGELEQDAHVVLFLYRPEYYLKPPEESGDEDADIKAEAAYGKRLDAAKNKLFWIVAKNRQGPTAEAETFCRIDCSAIRDMPGERR